MRQILCLLFLVLVQMTSAQSLDIQGHRGARGLLPENTILAFLRAIDEGVTTLEMDVVITKDKQVVVSHEPYMSSAICLDPKGDRINDTKEHNIFELSYEQVARYDCGILGNSRFPKQEKISTHKPLLLDVINEVEAYLQQHKLPKVSYNIELKSSPKGDHISHPGVKEFSDLVANLLQTNLDNSRYTIQCFDFRVLRYWNSYYPQTTLVALVENAKDLDTNLEELGFIPAVYSPYHVGVNQSLVDNCHEKDMKIIPWTVNSLKRMESLVEMGVDGIITDYPDLAKGLK